MGYLDECSYPPVKKQKMNANFLLKKSKNKNKKRKKQFKTPKYHEYIKSVQWRKRCRKYYESHEKRCWICNSTARIGLHHIHYKNLGREKDEDLIVLCWYHHERLHEHAGHNTSQAIEYIDQEKASIEFREIMSRI